MSALIVILHYRRPARAKALVGSLLAGGIDPKTILVVENASGDGSFDQLEPWLEQEGVPWIENAENLGFAGGMNEGLRWARDRGFSVALLLNDDLRIQARHLKAWVELFEKAPEYAVLGLPIYNDPEWTIREHGAETLNLWTGALGQEPLDSTREVQPCQWVSGAAFGIRVQALEDLGFLCEDFFMYWEELDFCLRAGREGWKVGVAAQLGAVHRDQGWDVFQGLALYLQWRNRWQISRRHIPWPKRLIFQGAGLKNALRDVLGRIRRGWSRTVWIPLLGNWHGLLGYRGTQGLAEIRRRSAELREQFGAFDTGKTLGAKSFHPEASDSEPRPDA